jgi:pimeloyl-ACP methyl ester carboxylesterase/DNA-binding SARP family transcriptional activator
MGTSQASSVRYARVAGASLAYQTWGDGPATIVAVPPLAQNIELTWERPEFRRMLTRLGSFARVLHFDKRGTGASDRCTHMPTMDERVEDLVAVMDAAGIHDGAHLLGVSEGGPVALQFAATYPRRVDGVVLVNSGARLVTEEMGSDLREVFVSGWGTDASITLDVFAPSAASDASYRAWEPRYERQSASPAALRELLEMIDAIDVRPLLASIAVPVLLLHRRDDRVAPVELAREAAAGLPEARLVELDGEDHMAQVGDVDAWLDHVEEFTTGAVHRQEPSAPAGVVRAEIRTMGGFSVRVEDEDVPLTAWGSRRARQLCKRLAVAGGRPVPRDELVEMLWPDEPDSVKLSARLSVLLSNIRRVLGGGLVADRHAVRLDHAAVQLDLLLILDALARGDDASAVAAYTGPVLPEDAYEDWAIAAREHLLSAVVGARRRLAAQAASASRTDDVVVHASAILDLDPYDERAHELLVRTLATAGRHGDARRAEARYRQRMTDLGVRPQSLLT